jgi:hypothetical protein
MKYMRQAERAARHPENYTLSPVTSKPTLLEKSDLP